MTWITVRGDIKRQVLEEAKQAKSKGRRWQRPDVFSGFILMPGLWYTQAPSNTGRIHLKPRCRVCGVLFICRLVPDALY